MRGRRAAVVAYGEVVFRAWKDGGWVRAQIGEDFLQGMVEAAVHAANKDVANAARRILWAFAGQKAVSGVEKLVFRLSEPVVFRSLQVPYIVLLFCGDYVRLASRVRYYDLLIYFFGRLRTLMFALTLYIFY